MNTQPTFGGFPSVFTSISPALFARNHLNLQGKGAQKPEIIFIFHVKLYFHSSFETKHKV